MYVKKTYVPVRRKKRRKRFPIAMTADDPNSSSYLFRALNAENIKMFKADQKRNPKKKEKSKKTQNTVRFDATPVDLKTVKENMKSKKIKETKRKEGVAVVKKFKFTQPEVKDFNDVMLSPNTTFDRLLHSSRKPLADKHSVLNVDHKVQGINSDFRTPPDSLSMKKRSNGTSTPILISPVFPTAKVSYKRRNIYDQMINGRENLFTPVLRHTTESVEKPSQQFSSFVAAPDSSCSSSPLLCNRQHKCGDSFSSPVAARTSSSIEIENTNYKHTHTPDSSQNLSGIKMRLRRTTASERHNNDSSFNINESFISTIKVQHKRNKKVKNQCNKAMSTRSSSNNFSTVLTRSKRISRTKGICETTINNKEIMSAHTSDERLGGDSVCNKSTTSSNIDESMPPLFRNKQKRSEYCCTNSNDQSRGGFLLPLVRRSQRNKRCSNSCVSVASDSPKCVQLQFATTCESPDMFSSLDEIETDIVPSKYVTVVKNYNSNFSTCNSNGVDTSNGNVSSSSTVGDYSCKYRASCRSSVVIDGKSDVIRKLTDKINLSSRDSNVLDSTRSTHTGPPDSTIVTLRSSDSTVRSSDSNNVVNELCADRSKSWEIELDNGGSFKATAENQCSRIIQKLDCSSSGAPSVFSVTSHSEMCTASILSQSAHQEESENPCNDLCGDADSHGSDQFKGRSLVHGMSLYCEENSERLNSTLSRRSSLCRRLSHVVIPERRKQGRSNSNESLQVSVRRAAPLSASVIIEEDELVEEDALTRGLLSARDMVLGKCNQSEPLTFEKAFPQRFFDNCKKIGEGLYGEVFFCQDDCASGKVLKIIPIEGAILVNGEKQKKYSEVLSELVIAMELSNLRHDAQFKTSCFVEVARCVCVQGKYPQRLIDLWNEYHEEKVSENDSPTIFDDSQLFLIFELADGGKALETYCFTSAAQAFSAFVQLSFALAVAEITLEFEHRDLHWGNVLIKKTPTKHITFKLNGEEYLVPSNGIQVTVIDYTLSRMSYGGCCIFNDLAVDQELFIAQGDYQFEVYRLMQNTVKNEWNNFRPYTNILWLHYTLGKMLHGVHYKNISTKIHKKFKTKLTDCYNDVLKHKSAYELVTGGNLLEMIK